MRVVGKRAREGRRYLLPYLIQRHFPISVFVQFAPQLQRMRLHIGRHRACIATALAATPQYDCSDKDILRDPHSDGRNTKKLFRDPGRAKFTDMSERMDEMLFSDGRFCVAPPAECDTKYDQEEPERDRRNKLSGISRRQGALLASHAALFVKHPRRFSRRRRHARTAKHPRAPGPALALRVLK